MLKSDIRLARWYERFIAWVVDVTVVGVIMILISIVLLENVDMVAYYIPENIAGFAGLDIALVSYTGMMIYWTVLEGLTGQTLGKRLLMIKTTDIQGQRIGLRSGLISSFGKAFLLPLDVGIGLLVARHDRQRLFNKLSNTIVVKMRCDVTF